MADLNREKERAAALLGRHRAGNDLTEAEAIPAADDVNALLAVGYICRDHPVKVNVYFFHDYEGASAARSKLLELPDEPGAVTRATVNGALLFVGRAVGGDAEAERRLTRLASSFAGSE